jgi:hypothetical protein
MELTQRDKAILLGNVDGRSLDDYDQQLYQMMWKVRPLGLEEIDDRARRAILQYIAQGKGEASEPANRGFVMMGFVHGYMVGQKLKRDIRSRK